jgi:hypothetical protein
MLGWEKGRGMRARAVARMMLSAMGSLSSAEILAAPRALMDQVRSRALYSVLNVIYHVLFTNLEFIRGFEDNFHD